MKQKEYIVTDFSDEENTRTLGTVKAFSSSSAETKAVKKFKLDPVDSQYISVRAINGSTFRKGETELNPRRIDLKPGRRNAARRPKPKRPAIGRRKTVRMSASGLMSRKSRKAAKRAMHRMTAQSKMLACHACSRRDFITEKSLKKHVAKFHTPGAKSPRGYRTRRDA